MPNNINLSAVDSLFCIASQVIKLHFGMWAENHTNLYHTTLGKETLKFSHSDAIENLLLAVRVHQMWSASSNLEEISGGIVLLTSLSSIVCVIGNAQFEF